MDNKELIIIKKYCQAVFKLVDKQIKAIDKAIIYLIIK